MRFDDRWFSSVKYSIANITIENWIQLLDHVFEKHDRLDIKAKINSWGLNDINAQIYSDNAMM